MGTGVVSVHNSFQGKDYRGFRATLFAGLGLTGIVPVGHSWVINHDVKAVNAALWLDILMGLLYLVSDGQHEDSWANGEEPCPSPFVSWPMPYASSGWLQALLFNIPGQHYEVP